MAKLGKTKKVGRPRGFRDEYCDQAHRLCLLGYTDEELAKFFGIARSTLSAWKLDYPEFSDSIKSGREDADSQVAKSMFERAIGYSHPEEKVFCNNGQVIVHKTVKHYPPDTQAGIFLLTNRQNSRFRDKKDLEHTGPDGGPVRMQIGWDGDD